MESVSVAELFAAYAQWRHSCQQEGEGHCGECIKHREVRFIFAVNHIDQQARIIAEFWVRRNATRGVEEPSRWNRQMFILTGGEAERLRHQLRVQYPDYYRAVPGVGGGVWRMLAAELDDRGARPLRELRLRKLLYHTDN